MRKFVVIVMALFVVGLGASVASAFDDSQLYEIGVNVGGTIGYAVGYPPVADPSSSYPNPPSSVSGFDYSLFSFLTGQGSITFMTTTPGTYDVLAFFNHEFDRNDNDITNEFADAFNSSFLLGGQSWDINDPLSSSFFIGNTLSNSVSPYGPGDVSMAMGQHFTLGGLDTKAIVTFVVSEDEPSSSTFYIKQWNDPTLTTSPESPIYLSSNLQFEQGGIPGVPEPATLVLLATGLLGLAGVRRKIGA